MRTDSLRKEVKIMSTRSIIKIVDNQDREIKLYHHYDGYLSGVGFDLLDMFIARDLTN